MGLFTFLKNGCSDEARGDWTIATQLRCYRDVASKFPEMDPHQMLAHVWLMRRSAQGCDIRGNAEAFQMQAMADTLLMACLPPPSNARALGIWFIFQERPDIIEACPKFGEEFDRLMTPVLKAQEDNDGTFEFLYLRLNPRIGTGDDKADAEKLYVIGMHHENGIGVPKDAAEAANWYRLAGRQHSRPERYGDFEFNREFRGHADAQYRLGLLYRKGEGVVKDLEEAAKWFRISASQGHGDAQASLDQHYAEKDKLPETKREDSSTFRRWFS